MNAWWHRATDALLEDFSDLNDPASWARLVARLSLAMILGGILGWDREHAGKAAGMRTHMLVAVGAAVFAFVGQQSGMASEGMSRVVQGLITGIGFLGAGAILKSNSQTQIEGLTTAAGIWFTAAIGLAAGTGHQATAIVSAVVAWIILAMMPGVERLFAWRS